MAKLGQHAVVLGASMGGMLAARVLADFYQTVTVVERDVLPDDPTNRRGCRRAGMFMLCSGVAAKSSMNSSPAFSTTWPLPVRRFSMTGISPRFGCQLADISWSGSVRHGIDKQ
jgi:hypothetical protein